MPQTRSVSMPLVLTITTGMCAVASSRDSARVAWKPFMPGRITSISTSCGRCSRAILMPSSAEPAAITSWPLRWSIAVNTAVSVGESSMIRMRAIALRLSPGPARGCGWR